LVNGKFQGLAVLVPNHKAFPQRNEYALVLVGLEFFSGRMVFARFREGFYGFCVLENSALMLSK